MKYPIALKLLFIFFFCLSIHICAQTEDSLRIVLQSNAKENRIDLRWLVSSSTLWNETNKSGFILERYTIKKNGLTLKNPEKIQLSNVPIKPRPAKDFENTNLIKDTVMAGVIAQSLYGKKLEMTFNKNSTQNNSQSDTKSQELDQRFMFSLYASCFSFDAACVAGWAWKDTTVVKGEEYLYKIYPADEVLAKSVIKGSVYTGLNFKRNLPIPSALKGDWGANVVTLSWNTELLGDDYVAYHVEKSEDGKVFHRITNVPVINLSNAENVSYQDTTGVNDKTYYYRICGVSIFGEIGPASNVVSGEKHKRLTSSPNIINHYVNIDGNVEIEWEFSPENNKLIKGFEIKRADSIRGEYKTIMKNISPVVRKTVYMKPGEVNYITVTAISLYGEKKESFPILIQPIDSVPPLPPTGLSGSIDSLGVVTLKWKPNTEKDLLGYRIFSSYTKEGQMIQKTDLAFRGTVFTDTVKLDNLNPIVYYSVAALDNHYNQSKLSVILPLKKPDIIPPSSPVISNYESTEDGIKIQWINSSSDDVAKIRIYRSSYKDSFKIIKEFTNLETTEYIDRETEYGKDYRYRITAIDQSKLESEYSPELSVRSITDSKFSVSFTAKKMEKPNAVLLNWKLKPEANLFEIQIYRKSSEYPLSLWKTLSPWENSITDTNVLVGSEYEYLIRFVPKEGKVINSKIVGVTFK